MVAIIDGAGATSLWTAAVAVDMAHPLKESSLKSRNNFLAQPKLLKSAILTSPLGKINSEDGTSKDEVRNLFNPVPTSANARDDPLDVSKTGDATDDKKREEAVPKFVPLHSGRDSVSFASASVKPVSQGEFSNASDFVFGQNLKDRIVSRPDEAGESSASNIEHVSTNGTSSFLFSAAAQAAVENQNVIKGESSSSTNSTQIWERIREPTVPNLPPQQQVLTGEEGEINQLQINCRLFAFESGLWKELGRGQLRLNDADSCSRLVCRSAGSLRILLNTKIWGSMTVERAGNKSLRITATDSQQHLRVFLIMASPEEINQLHKMIGRRVHQAQIKDETKKADEKILKNDSVENVEFSKSEIDVGKSKSEEQAQRSDGSKDRSNDEKENKVCDKEDENDSDSISYVAGNPVVVISNDDDENVSSREALKRPQETVVVSTSKKMCMEFPPVDENSS